MKKKIFINGSKNGRCLNFKKFVKQLLKNEPNLEFIVVNSSEEYKSIKSSINQSPKYELYGRINPFSIK